MRNVHGQSLYRSAWVSEEAYHTPSHGRNISSFERSHSHLQQLLHGAGTPALSQVHTLLYRMHTAKTYAETVTAYITHDMQHGLSITHSYTYIIMLFVRDSGFVLTAADGC